MPCVPAASPGAPSGPQAVPGTAPSWTYVRCWVARWCHHALKAAHQLPAPSSCMGGGYIERNGLHTDLVVPKTLHMSDGPAFKASIEVLKMNEM